LVILLYAITFFIHLKHVDKENDLRVKQNTVNFIQTYDICKKDGGIIIVTNPRDLDQNVLKEKLSTSRRDHVTIEINRRTCFYVEK